MQQVAADERAAEREHAGDQRRRRARSARPRAGCSRSCRASASARTSTPPRARMTPETADERPDARDAGRRTQTVELPASARPPSSRSRTASPPPAERRVAAASTIIWRVVPDEHVRAVHALQQYHTKQERRLTRELRIAAAHPRSAPRCWRSSRGAGGPRAPRPSRSSSPSRCPPLSVGPLRRHAPLLREARRAQPAARQSARHRGAALRLRRSGGITIGGESFEDKFAWTRGLAHRRDAGVLPHLRAPLRLLPAEARDRLAGDARRPPRGLPRRHRRPLEGALGYRAPRHASRLHHRLVQHLQQPLHPALRCGRPCARGAPSSPRGRGSRRRSRSRAARIRSSRSAVSAAVAQAGDRGGARAAEREDRHRQLPPRRRRPPSAPPASRIAACRAKRASSPSTSIASSCASSA